MIRSTISEIVRKQRKITASSVSPRIEMRDLKTFIFFYCARVACPWQEFFIEGHTGRRKKGGRSSDEVTEQGDEVHLAEGTADGARGNDSTAARVR